MNGLKRLLRGGGRALGCIQTMASADVTEVLGGMGFDVLMLDQEHGRSGLDDAVAQLRALRGTTTAAMVRVPAFDPSYVHRLLDAGVDGLVFPDVRSAHAAAAVVDACRYPPRGSRGAGGGLRATGYDSDLRYYERAHDDLLIVVQVESVDAMPELSAITAVEGVDLVMIGPRDLSASLGRLNRFDDPVVREAFAAVESAIAGGPVPMASTVYPGMSPAQMFDRGHRLLLLGTDVGLIARGARSVIEAAR